MLSLPVDQVLSELLQALDASGAAVLVAPPGAGKTTRVPPAMVRGKGTIWVLEPRRIAARAAARRVAQEQGWTLGEEVGWAVRFEKKFKPTSKIVYCTEGVLLRRLQADPFLEGVDALVLDEFHERHMEGDLALAMAERVRSSVREDLRIVVMSATLIADPISEFLRAKVVRSEGRQFDVEERYLPLLPREKPEDHLQRAVETALAGSPGNVLVFLPGAGEMRRARRRIESWILSLGLDLHDLHGSLSPQDQDLALTGGGRRRVVLSTNVAESSVTVDGVTAVVDSGLARILRHDPSVGLDRLGLERIAADAAAQRAGRAGRIGPGLVLRLWSSIDQRTLRPSEEPEVRRLDLAGPVLQLLSFGEPDPAEFPWFEAPKPEALDNAVALLDRLGATDHGVLTKMGRSLAALPVHPRLGRLLVAGHGEGVPHEVALVAALLGERDPFEHGQGPVDGGESDLDERLDALETLARTKRAPGGLRPGPGRNVLRSRDQLASMLQRVLGQAPQSGDPDDALLRALLTAFPDRLAVRRAPGSDAFRGIDGKGLRLARESCVTEAEVILALETIGTARDARVRLAVGVPRSFINGGNEHMTQDLIWDREALRVRGAQRTWLGPLLLGEEVVSLPRGRESEVQEILCAEAAKDLENALGFDESGVQSLLARLACLGEWCPELELPRFDGEQIAEHLPNLATGCRSFEDLRKRPLASLLLGLLTYQQRSALDIMAPERMAVPTGSKITLLYEAGRPPVLAVRMQELFGLKNTPTVAGGRVTCLLHLLAPNHRPQQITDDLAGFWERTWKDVRKDLRNRYPRHAWPLDPANAVPQKRPARRRRR
ncbi:MAG TPA: ATP-dependent helicase HrpB [Planctomycetes bacterium]|nr:ATP-dependent helicase HrpB [Planctomycetota bacterium]HIL37838.1 ATP-dependent helicase HrpB [Planctomycetota bacterium]